MSNNLTTAFKKYPSNTFPHVFWIELNKDGIVHECAVVKQSADGSLSYVKINELDNIDKTRLVRILSHPRAAQYPLYELMSQQTLQNGINALAYFHQFVKVISPSGLIYDPRAGMHVTAGSQALSTANTSSSTPVTPAVSK